MVNLAYQGLGHPFQTHTFNKICGRLGNAEVINLRSNNITSAAGIRLPTCKSLNLSFNSISSFSQLPAVPALEKLNLIHNAIEKLSGIGRLKSVRELSLDGNDVRFIDEYRKRVFLMLPDLKVLDGIPKQKIDIEPLNLIDPQDLEEDADEDKEYEKQQGTAYKLEKAGCALM